MGSNIFAMPAASIALLLSFAFGATSALPWNGPQETKVYRAEDFSPKPTGVPVEAARLFKRDSVPVNVCGWIAGRPESVARCGSGSSCIHDTMHGVIGCCATAGACTDGVYTTCVDSGMEGWNSVPGMINNGVLSCKASSTCFQNSFPGKYKQYSCGESDLGGEIQTSYEGQAKDMRLQVVYTGVTYSPMSKPAFTTVPFDTATIIPEAGKAKASPTGAAETTSSDNTKEETTGYIAGGTIGGVAFAAILIAGIILYLRRRKIRKGQRVGGFVSLHHEEKPPTAGPFKRLTQRYSTVNDFGPLARRSTAQEVAYMSPNADGTTYISPLTGHPNDSHAPYNIPQDRIDRDLLSSPMTASTYNGAFPETYDTATVVPISRLNIHGPNQTQTLFTTQSGSPSPQLLPSEEQRQPLVGLSIDNYGQSNWNSNLPLGYGGLGQQKDTHIHDGDMPETTDMGLVSTVRRAASQMVTSNGRTADLNVRSESMRHSDSQEVASEFEDEIWNSQPMNPPQIKAGDSLQVGLGIGNGNASSSSSSRTLVNTEQSQEKALAEKPLMEQMMEAFNAATRVGGEPSVVVKKDVHQLVDEGVAENSELGVNRGMSNAGLLRKPVGGTILHKRTTSGGLL